MSARPAATELLKTPGALLLRTDLLQLGLERRAVDVIFRRLPVVVIPGYSRPFVRADDVRHFFNENTYAGDRVRPTQYLPG